MNGSVDDFLKELLGTPEYDYHAAVWSVLKNVEFDPNSEMQGFALLDLLSQGELVTDKLDTTKSPIAGSIEENALLISRMFEEVGKCPTWWKANYPWWTAKREIWETISWWEERLQMLPEVITAER